MSISICFLIENIDFTSTTPHNVSKLFIYHRSDIFIWWISCDLFSLWQNQHGHL